MEENEDLICGICLHLADMAVETTCCHQLFCELCIEYVRNCPMCRKLLNVSPNYVIRRIINKLMINCELCSLQIKNANKDSHLEECPERFITCVVENCSFTAKKDGILQHLTSEHVLELTSPKYKLGLRRRPQNGSQNTADLIWKINSAGKTARLGSTGKYYCSGDLGFVCGCCIRCGLNNGCNCLPCFRLDLLKLSPDFLINNKGHRIKPIIFPNNNRINCQCVEQKNSCYYENNCQACQLMERQLHEGGCYHEVTHFLTL